jgi:murein DD-endopeptidase MepM/ murein hydrolase activator NlpD
LTLACLSALAWIVLRHPLPTAAIVPPIAEAPLGPLLAEDTRLTAGFADPRGLRLHAGVDYSTNRERGMPVLAPAGGWISRISTEYGGYGLHVMLTDSLGRRHLFAHLSRLRGDLAEELARTQEERGAFVQVLEPAPGRFPARAGEVVAWSGDTGNGPPHLHYELRGAEGDRCFNPLRHGLGTVADPFPPQLQGLALVPLECGAQAMSGLLPRRLEPESVGRGRWRLADTLDCRGSVGLALLAVDHLPGQSARLAPWRVDLVEEGDTLFRLCLDSFPLSANDQSGRLFSRWLQEETGRPWLRLWGGGGALGLWEGGEMEAGRLRPDPARPLRHLQVLARDAAENLSVLDLVLRLLPLPAGPASFAPVDSAELALLREEPARPATVTKWVKRGKRGKRVRRVVKAPPPPPPPPPAWSLLPLPDGLHLRLSPLPAAAAQVGEPGLLLDGRPLAAWGQLRDKGWEWALPAAALQGRELRVAEQSAAPSLALGGLWLEPGLEIVWRDHAAEPAVVLYADKGTVAEPARLLFRRWREPTGVFSLGPPDLQWERDLQLEISLEALPAALRGRAALFQTGAGGRPMALVGGRVAGDRLLVSLARGGSYVLHADTRGPTIKLRKPAAVKVKRKRHRARWRRPEHYPPRPALVWEIGGDPSGIANVVLLEEGRRHFPPYEPDTHLVHFQPAESWPAGSRELELRVTDRSGNESVLRSTVRVGPSAP